MESNYPPRAVPHSADMGIKRVEVGGKPEFWSLIRRGLFRNACGLDELRSVIFLREHWELHSRRGGKKKWRGHWTCLRCDSNKPSSSASSQEMPIMLRALDSTESRKNRCDAGVPAHRGEQYYIELWTNGLWVLPCRLSCSDLLRNDLRWLRMPICGSELGATAAFLGGLCRLSQS